jgi:hypothetical protein
VATSRGKGASFFGRSARLTPVAIVTLAATSERVTGSPSATAPSATAISGLT